MKRSTKAAERSLAAVLFTDIVGSTERATELGDHAWRQVLEQHHARVRGELRRFGGHEVATAGDGFLALFDEPGQAMVCAWAVRDAVREVGVEIRCGVHMGAVDHAEGNVGGIGVHIAARVLGEADAGEILVSQTVHDAEAGSGFVFEDRGTRPLKGVSGERHGSPELGLESLASRRSDGQVDIATWWRPFSVLAFLNVLLAGRQIYLDFSAQKFYRNHTKVAGMGWYTKGVWLADVVGEESNLY